MFLFFVLIFPGLVVAYALFLRPALHKIPALAKFYSEADGFWSKAWAVCGKSVTVLWGYILGGLGSALALVDPLAKMLGDPDFKTQVATALQGNPAIVGYFAIVVSVITIAARLRSIAASA